MRPSIVGQVTINKSVVPVFELRENIMIGASVFSTSTHWRNTRICFFRKIEPELAGKNPDHVLVRVSFGRPRRYGHIVGSNVEFEL